MGYCIMKSANVLRRKGGKKFGEWECKPSRYVM